MEDINDLYSLINKEYADILVNLINKNQLRKPKYSTEYYLYFIILVLTDLQKWKSLNLKIIIKQFKISI